MTDVGGRPSAPGRSAWLLALALLVTTAVRAGADDVEPHGILDDFPRAGLALVPAGAGRCLWLDVYIAATDRQRSRGLMFVTALPEFAGMYFPYPEPAWISMWMKNTLIPLDMAFVRPDGTIAAIAAEARPQSLETITAPEPVSGVLEVNGGFMARWGIRPGDRLVLTADSSR